jgi:NAD(P)-dependent dehydrogenase (short-subunit alcohol dehydrogenase family)
VGGLLDGSRAVVTGAARGIGAATARRFCEEGAKVVLADVDADAVGKTTATLRAAGHEAHAAVVDVTDEGLVTGVLNEAAERLGGLNVVVANAGVLVVDPIEKMTLEAFERVLLVNLVGVFLTLKQAVPHLRAAGGGVLLCTASQAGVRGYPEMSAYCASKFGVVGLVESLAQELAPDGIRVCAVAPGMTKTAMYDDLVDGREKLRGGTRDAVERQLLGTLPFGRPAGPEEVANGFLYLASPLASYVSGIAHVIDGAELS